METFKLKRTVQCAKCPWKCTSNPLHIPNYSPEQHKGLNCTIAQDNNLDFDIPIQIFACHHSKEGNEQPCVGWLTNQLQQNNIKLRLKMLACTNFKDLRTIGKQHQNFQDTLPKIV
jgi:hypothetical protein